MIIETMKRCLAVIESHIEKFDSEQFTSICELDPAKEAAEELRQAIEKIQTYKPEFLNEDGQTAYVFGWFKALEVQRMEQKPYAWEFAGTIFHDRKEVFDWYERGDVSNIPPLPLYTSPQPKENNNA